MAFCKAIVGSRNQRFEGFEKLALSDFPPEIAPKHFNGMEPRAVGWQISPHQPTGSPTDDSFDFIVWLGIGLIPGHINRLSRRLFQERFPEFRDFLAALALANENYGFTCRVVASSNAIVFLGLVWGSLLVAQLGSTARSRLATKLA